MLNFLQALLESALLLTPKIKDSASNFEHGIDNLTEKFEVLPLLLLQICKGASQGTDRILLHHDYSFLTTGILIFMWRFQLVESHQKCSPVKEHLFVVELWGLYYMERASIPMNVNGSCWAAILAYGITDLFKKLLKLSCKYHINDHSGAAAKLCHDCTDWLMHRNNTHSPKTFTIAAILSCD